MRRQRSPPAAMKVVTTRISTSARNAMGSRRSRRGAGRPALRVLAASSARSTWARHNATDHGSLFEVASSSAMAVAGRWARPAIRSRRRKPSAREGNRTKISGTVAAAVRTRKTNSATARAIGGSHSQAPAHETARNSPIAVAMAASGGHSRSQKVIQRAFFRARTSMAPATSGEGASGEWLASVNQFSRPG